MDEHRLFAPSADGEILAVPPLTEVPTLLDFNAQHLAAWNHDFQGRSASRLRREIRARVLDASRLHLKTMGLCTPPIGDSSRLMVTGHQPELFHPGVWIKNFALARLSAQTGSVALNLIVDNDVPKSSAIKVPRQTPGAIRIEKIHFDDWAGEVPYEDLDVSDEALFASFGDRARTVLGHAVSKPLIDEIWPRALESRKVTNRVGLRFATARHGVEAAWGIHNLEIPLSAVCEMEGFQWFVCHLLAHLPRFRQIHNDALGRYRALYGIRSENHPVPALRVENDWLEAPFWVWRKGRPRRKPLLVRQLSKTIEMRIGGETERLLELPLGPDREACCAVDRLLELPSQGVRLRTRALTTTMFARYLLGDLFLHGIGGAKYDELGDEISGRFFGIEPPGYLTTSMTLRLGLQGDPRSAERLAIAGRISRDHLWNPDRYLVHGDLQNPETAGWVTLKRAALDWPVETHSQRVSRFYELRRCNEALRMLVSDRLSRLEEDRKGLIKAVERERLARSREYSLVLHSGERLLRAFDEALPGLFVPN